MLRDLRYAFRNLRRAPLFTAIALLSLALGIGANTALFTVADHLLLRDLPVAHAPDLLYFTSPGDGASFSYPMFRDLRDNASGFAAIAARFSTPVAFSYNNRSDRVRAELVSGTYFDTLGLSTFLGRPLGPSDDRTPGGHSVCVLTYDFWRARFHRDKTILNKVVLVNGHPMVVVGIAAPRYHGFDVADPVAVLVPTMMKAAMTPTWNALEDRRVHWLQIVGRLDPGIDVATAGARLEPFYRALQRVEAADSPDFTPRSIRLVPAPNGVSDLRADIAPPLRILTAIVALLLLIACANVANLLLARAVRRQREIAIRLAMGAPRERLIRQLVTESVVLAIVGGALGLLVAAWIVTGLLSLLATPTAAPLDLRVFAFTFALSLATGVVFGLAPAWHATSPEIARVLKDQASAIVAPAGDVRLRKVLCVLQVAVSLFMLIGAALFTRSLLKLDDADIGFHSARLLTFELDPALNGYTPDRIRALAQALQQRLDAAVADADLLATDAAVTPGYFAALGIPFVAGRDFTPADRAGTARAAIVTNAHGGAVGDRLPDGRAIVGVVRSPRRAVYTPLLQDRNPGALVAYTRANAATVRREVAQLDAALPIANIRTVAEQLAEAHAAQRLMATVTGCVAIVATILAAVGLYGLMAYLVNRRAREIGLRLALGADPATLRREVLREVANAAALGIAIAIPLAVALAQIVRSNLYEVAPWDPLSVLAPTAATIGLTLIAGYIPAARAVKATPHESLKH
jgi:ABC-type lipoprotein release transport system permease subunit